MKTGLDKRITFVVFVVATLVMALFAVLASFLSAQIEERALDQLVISEFGEIQRKLALNEPESLNNTAQLHSWLTQAPNDKGIPRAFRRLPVGIHHEIEEDNSLYHVLRQPADNRFLTLALEINLVEERELQFNLLLAGMVLLAPGLVMLLSFLFTRSLTEPVVKLAGKLQALDPSDRHVRLGKEFSGDEVEAIAQAFDRYQERLDLMIEREQSFSSAASHELRTPLASISASAELLAGMRGLPDAAGKYIDRINNAVRTMTDVVNSLLALSRDSRSKPESPLHVRPVLEEAVVNYREQLVGKDVSLEFQCDEELLLWISMGDFLIVLGNLLQNAIRNTERGRIRVSCDKNSLVVSDTGRGMPKEFAAYIFDKHVQAHDSHGVGLGLHIVKRLCERQGWRIRVDSDLGRGTTVTVDWH
jgi:signal transduction histidine kinase